MNLMLLRRRPDFATLWTGQAASQLGSRVFGVAYMLWVLAETGSALRLGLVASLMLAVFSVAQLPAGWLADRFDRRRVMAACDVMSALASLSLASAALTGRFSLAHLLCAGAVLGSGWGVRGTSEMSSLPSLVEPGELDDAASITEARGYATGLAGPPLAGQLFALWTPLPFLLDGVSYLVAGVCASRIRVPLRAVRAERSGPAWTEIRDGLRVFWSQRFVRWTAALSAGSEMLVNAVGLCVIVMLRSSGASPQSVGIVLGMGMAGGLAGAVLAPTVRRATGSLRTLLVAGPAASAVAAAGLSGADGTLLVGLAYAAVFLLQPAWDAAIAARSLELVDDAYRGRVQAAIGLVGTVPLVATPAGAGLLLAAVAPRPACLILGAGFAAVAVAALLSRAVRSHAARAPAPANAPALV